MRLSTRSLRWLLPVLLLLSTAAQVAAQKPKPRIGYSTDLLEQAERGDAEAQLNLGRAYAVGNGVKEDGDESVRWLRKAADSGNADAMLDLGTDCEIGYHMEKDKDEALRWYRKAFEHGSKYAGAYAMRINGVDRRDVKTVEHCPDGASTNFSEHTLQHERWFYPLCTTTSIEDQTNCPDGFFSLAGGCVAGLAQCPSGYTLVSLSVHEFHVKQLSYKCHVTDISIAPDKLAFEPVFIGEEKQACSNESDPNFCRSDFLRTTKYKRVRLSPKGSMGVIVEIDATSLCGSGGCPLFLLKQAGKEYRIIWEGQGVIGEVSLEKSTTNGAYDIGDLQEAHNQSNFQKYFWNGSKYLTEKNLQAERQQMEHAERVNATSQARVATEQSVAKSQAAVVSALPDGDARAAARRQYASALESAMAHTLRNDQDVDPTLVSLRVYTKTPTTDDGSKTRDDFRLNVETNSIALPRDVVALLRKPMLNRDLYKLGFRELEFQDTVGEQMGSILCVVILKPEGAHPAYCMKIEERFVPDNNKYNNDAGYWGYRASDWTPYHQWPKDYIVH